MTARSTVTEATIARALKAARKNGLPVHAIVVAPDGTVILDLAGESESGACLNEWDEVIEAP